MKHTLGVFIEAASGSVYKGDELPIGAVLLSYLAVRVCVLSLLLLVILTCFLSGLRWISGVGEGYDGNLLVHECTEGLRVCAQQGWRHCRSLWRRGPFAGYYGCCL